MHEFYLRGFLQLNEYVGNVYLLFYKVYPPRDLMHERTTPK